jgi:hypothetical protein
MGNTCRTPRDVFLTYDGSLAQSRLSFLCCFTTAAKCAATKMKAAGKKAACLLDVQARSAARGAPPDAAKLAVCEQKMQDAFAKSESKGGCNTMGDASAIENKVDAFSSDVQNELRGPSASKCDAAKLKTAGKRAGCTLSVRSKAVGKGLVPDQLKLQACVDKMMAAFTKAEGVGGCNATGDAGAIGGKIDAFADDVVAELECKCASPSGAFLDAAAGAGY